MLFGAPAVIGFFVWGFFAFFGFILFGTALSVGVDSFKIITNYFNAEHIEYPTTELYCSAVSYGCNDDDPICLNREHYIPSSLYVKIDREQFAPDFITEPTVNITYTNDKIIPKLQPSEGKTLKVDKKVSYVSHDESSLNTNLIAIDQQNIFESDKFYEWINIQDSTNRYYLNENIDQSDNKLTGKTNAYDIYDELTHNWKVCDEIGYINWISTDEDINKNKSRYLSALLNNQIVPRTDRFQDIRIKKPQIVPIAISEVIDQYIKAYEERKNNKVPRYEVKINSACESDRQKDYNKEIDNIKNWKKNPVIIKQLNAIETNYKDQIKAINDRYPDDGYRTLRGVEKDKLAKSYEYAYEQIVGKYTNKKNFDMQIQSVHGTFERTENKCSPEEQSYTIISDNHDENLSTINKEITLTQWVKKNEKNRMRSWTSYEVKETPLLIDFMKLYLNAKLNGEEFFIVDRQAYYMNDIDIKTLEENLKIPTHQLLKNGYKPDGNYYRWCVNNVTIDRETLQLSAQTINLENPYSYNLKSNYQCDIVDKGTIKSFHNKNIKKRVKALAKVRKDRKEKTINIKENNNNKI